MAVKIKSHGGTLPGRGAAGMDAYELAVRHGFVGSVKDWIASLKGKDGDDGLSTYEVAVANGFEGTEAEWLEKQLPIPGPPGPEGPRGPIGPMPRHEWNGTELRFQLAPDRWGAWVDLKGDKGDKGEDGKGGGVGTAIVGGSVRVFSLNLPGFVPAPGAGGATKFLRGDATWQTVTATGGSSFGYMPQGWT
jgi:hypothetical protein